MDADLGFRRCNDSSIYKDLEDCIDRPEIDCTRGMVNYRLVEKRDPRAFSPEADRAADPISDWETDQLPTLKEILQNGRKIGPAVKKHFQGLPVLDEDRSCALWASRADGDILSYRLELTDMPLPGHDGIALFLRVSENISKNPSHGLRMVITKTTHRSATFEERQRVLLLKKMREFRHSVDRPAPLQCSM